MWGLHHPLRSRSPWRLCGRFTGRTVKPSGAFLTLTDLPRDISVLAYKASSTRSLTARADAERARRGRLPPRQRSQCHARGALGLRLGDPYTAQQRRYEQHRASPGHELDSRAVHATRYGGWHGSSTSASPLPSIRHDFQQSKRRCDLSDVRARARSLRPHSRRSCRETHSKACQSRSCRRAMCRCLIRICRAPRQRKPPLAAC